MNRARSLRFRLTALNLLVFGLLQGGVLLSLFLASSAWLRLDFDEWLRARAEELRPHMSPSPSTQRLSDAVRFEGMIIQLTTADGRVLYRSEQSTYYLPETRSPAGGKEFETLPPAREGDSPYRLYSTPHQDEAGEPMLLQVGASLDRLQSTLKTQRTILILVFPLSLLLVALASWLLVGQALAPLSKIIREAPTIDAAHLDRRLPAPGAPRELQELVVSLNGMLDRLQHGFRAQERFLAEASHELRTPIAVLLGEAQVLAKQPRDERTYQEYLALAESELQRLSRTLDSLLILARANAGHAVRLAERVSINEVVLTAVQRQMAASDVPIDVRLTEDADPIVLGDEPLLVTCVSNLLSNV
ncbi:MAG: histidine kinase dimerization/phospho-acceptor domain-containing protein [Planctomycetota bacterium]